MWTFSFMNRTWRQRNRGAVLVEFAILTPILVLLAFGIAELGRVLYQQNTLTKSVASGARYLARGYDILDTDDCAAKPLWSSKFVPKAKNLVVYGTFATGVDPLVPNLTIGNVDITYDQRPFPAGCADDDDVACACVISVSATEIPFAGIFGDGKTVPLLPSMGEGGWGGFADVSLNAATEERYIGE